MIRERHGYDVVGGGAGNGVANVYIKVAVNQHSNLPDAIDYDINDLGLVYNGEEEFFSSVITPWTAPKYKYPPGLYIVRDLGGGKEWYFYQTQTINAINTVIIDVTTDWVAFFNQSPVVKQFAMIDFNGTIYRNETGAYSINPPNIDSTNWTSTVVSAAPRNPVQLKAISLLDQSITTAAAGTIPIPEVIQESNGVTVSNGEITFSRGGFYRVQLQLNLDNNNNSLIETWAEFFNGSTWENVTDSGNIIETSSSNEGNFLVESTFIVPDNFMIRLKARVITGGASFNTSTLANGVEVPSMTFIAYEIDPVVYGLAVDTQNLSEPFYIGSGANRTRFETDGTIVNEGDSLTWQEVSTPLFGQSLDTSLGRIDYNYAELTIDYASNARYPEEQLGVVTQLLHSRKSLSEIRPHLHWIQNSNNFPNLLIEYRAFNNGELVPGSFTQKALTVSDNLFAYPGSGNFHQITEFNLPVAVGESLGLSGTFECKIYRDSANASGLFAGADTYPGVLSVKYYDIHFINDMLGSREEYTK